MQKIPVNLARPGMTLAKPVKREDGLVIVGEKTELSEAIIARLDNMGIKRIVVEGEPVDMSGEGGGSAAKRVERMDHLFRKHAGDKWMMKFKAILKRYFKAKAAADNAPREEEGEDKEAGNGQEISE